jgi:hypothetical protein
MSLVLPTANASVTTVRWLRPSGSVDKRKLKSPKLNSPTLKSLKSKKEKDVAQDCVALKVQLTLLGEEMFGMVEQANEGKGGKDAEIVFEGTYGYASSTCVNLAPATKKAADKCGKLQDELEGIALEMFHAFEQFLSFIDEKGFPGFTNAVRPRGPTYPPGYAWRPYVGRADGVAFKAAGAADISAENGRFRFDLMILSCDDNFFI